MPAKADELALIIKSALWDDREAFGILVTRYSSPLRRFLTNLTDDDELAKDLTQEAFIKAWLNISSFRAAASFSTWLYRIAYNTFYDHIKKQREYCNNDCLQQLKDETQVYDNIDSSIDFNLALRQLSDKERTVVLLHYLDDFNIQQIAKITGIAQGSIKSHLHRARKKMAHFIKQD